VEKLYQGGQTAAIGVGLSRGMMEASLEEGGTSDGRRRWVLV
jgi:hypothetical protein